jgi:small subunit ribosomal protein S7
MSRRSVSRKRSVAPDLVFNDYLVAKFVNSIMYDGKKSLAENIFYKTISSIKEKTGKDGYELFKLAVENVKPVLEVKSRRVGGATYQVPVEVRQDRRIALSIKWILSAARNRKEHTMVEKLTAELIDAASEKGSAIKKKEDTHKMAEANRAFAHFRW